MSFKDDLTERVFSLVGDNVIGFKVTVFDRFCVLVEGFKGVTAIADDGIKLRAGKIFITLCGENLKITELSANEAYVKGKITDVHMEAR